MGKLESNFQSDLMTELKEIYKDPYNDVVTKFEDIQGFPDILILHGNKWAMLECKKSEHEARQPNQDFYVDILNKMSYASFIYPENKERVLNELQSALPT